MKNLLCVVILSLLFAGACSSTALARTVYLKDGSVIENAKSAWQSKGIVHVLVNRDTYLTFEAGEVDVKRTFAKQKNGHVSRTAQRHKHHAAQSGSTEAKGNAVAATKNGDSAVAQNPADKKATAPAMKPAAVKSVAAKSADGAARAGVDGKEKAVDSKAKAIDAKAKGGVAKSATAAGAGTSNADKAKPAAANPQTKPLPEQKAAGAAPPQNQGAQPEAKPQPKISDFLWAFLKTPSGQVALLMLFIVVVSFWKVFEKAGQAGWKSLIPIYNVIVLLEIAGKPIWWILLLLIPFLNVIFLLLMHMELAKRFSKHPVFGVGMTFLPAVFFGILAFDKSSYGAGGDGDFTFE